MGLLWFLLMGALAGWLAGNLMKGSGFGAVGNVVVGVVGGVVGGYLFRLFGFYTQGLLGSLISATVGAVLLIYVVGLIKKP